MLVMGAGPLICSGKSVEPEQSRTSPRVGKTRSYLQQQPPPLSGCSQIMLPREDMCEVEKFYINNGARNSRATIAAPDRVEKLGMEDRQRINHGDSVQESGVRDSLGHHIIADRVVMEKYDIRTLVGRGTFSHVFHVENRTSGEELALKVVKRKTAVKGNSYVKEIEILRLCNHPSIITLHEVVKTSDTMYMVLDLALGGDLYDYISSKGPFQEDRGVAILRMASSGLSYLHHLEITHRDLKLENVLFKNDSEDSTILITDFGLGHYSASTTNGRSNGRCRSNARTLLMSTTCGTAEYMSPEMLRGDEYSEKIDVWSLGVVGYTILSGRMPFIEGEGGRARLYQNIMSGKYSFADQVWCEVSKHAKDFIQQLLCVDVGQRLNSTQALNHPWMKSDPTTSTITTSMEPIDPVQVLGTIE